MHIKSVLDLQKAHAEVPTGVGVCEVECLTQGIIEEDDEHVTIVYIMKSTIPISWDVIHEFIHTKCHSNISNSTCFAIDNLSHTQIKDIFKKIHNGYLELILCRADFVEREFIVPKKLQACAPTPPPSPSTTLRLSPLDLSLINSPFFSDDEEEEVVSKKPRSCI